MGRSPTSPELHPSTQGSWNPPLQLERVDLSSLIFHFHSLDSYYSLYNFSIQISVISRWDSGAHTSIGRTRHGKEMSGVRLPAVETMSQFLCAHGPQDSRFRVEAQQPGGEGCLLRAVIHGGLFLSRRGCKVSPPLEMGKSLHLPIHSTQLTWISAEFSGKMWLTTGFLSIEMEYWASWQISNDSSQKSRLPLLLQAGHSLIAEFPTALHCSNVFLWMSSENGSQGCWAAHKQLIENIQHSKSEIQALWMVTWAVLCYFSSLAGQVV